MRETKLRIENFLRYVEHRPSSEIVDFARSLHWDIIRNLQEYRRMIKNPLGISKRSLFTEGVLGHVSINVARSNLLDIATAKQIVDNTKQT